MRTPKRFSISKRLLRRSI